MLMYPLKPGGTHSRSGHHGLCPYQQSVCDLGMSDHKVISLELPFPSPHIRKQHQLRFRNLKNINPDNLTVDLQRLSAELSSASDSVDFYNKTMHNILDLHAPIGTRTVSFSCSTPWFCSELWKMKTARLKGQSLAPPSSHATCSPLARSSVALEYRATVTLMTHNCT